MSAPDDLIAGRYRLVRRVGSGAMGVVWEARDERLHRRVAIKQLHPQRGVSDAEAELAGLRAMREARITARLDHPHAVPVYDVVEADGQPCLIMQFLPSTPLSVVLRERRTLPLVEVARIGSQVASALAAAHQARIVHRDVKPGNILIAGDGTARISDFGISHALGDSTLTVTGMVHGTPAYLAPEVARGAESSFASDVFGLGATLYAATEGKPPFGTDPNAIALLYRVASGEFVPPTRSGPLTPLLLRMLAPEPADRPAMAGVAQELAELAARGGVDPATLEMLGNPQPTGPDHAAAGDLPATAALAPPTLATGPVARGSGAGWAAGAAAGAGWAVTGDTTDGAGAAASSRASSAAASGANPDDPAPERRTSRRVLAAVLVLLLLAGAALALVPLLQDGDQDGPAAGSTPSTSAASTAPPTTSGTPTPDSPSPAPSTASPTSAAPTTAAPSTAKPSTTKPTSAAPTTTKPSATSTAPTTGTPTAKQLSTAITSYYALVPGDEDAGWDRLTSAYQQRAGGRAAYERFWDSVDRVSVSEVEPDPPSTVRADVRYVYKSGRTVEERTSFGMRREDGVLKINSSDVQRSRG